MGRQRQAGSRKADFSFINLNRATCELRPTREKVRKKQQQQNGKKRKGNEG